MKSFTLSTQVGELAANLYLPTNQNLSDSAEKAPLVIVTGAWTTVKEQMPAVYAKALSEQGYAALTFDFRGWGLSPDATPYLEDPQRKTDDIRAVIAAIVAGDMPSDVAEYDAVDTSRLYGIGVCASAGYMLDAVSGNAQVKAAAVVVPWLHNPTIATAIYGGEESAASLLAAAESAAKADEPVLMEAASTTNEGALMYQAPYYTETGRGLIPEYDNQFNVASWTGWLNYDALAGAETQDKPVLMVASNAMALPDGAKAYLEQASDNVTAVWLEDVTQFDFYDVAEHVATAAKAVAQHFNAH
jgi:fermentation-respiration switch protein FrsA (DUF1100 family)